MAGHTPMLDVQQIPPPADLIDPPADAIQTPPTAPRNEALIARVLKRGEGSGSPADYDLVTVHYTMWAADGRTIADSRSRGEPAVWTWPQMMPGLRIALSTMTPGEQRRLWIPRQLGDQWAEGPLVLDVELVRFEPSGVPTAADFDAPPVGARRTSSGIAWHVLRPGNGRERPRPMSTVTIYYRAWSKDHQAHYLFDDCVARREPLTLAVDSVIPGLSEALQLMVVGEKTRFWIPAQLAYHPPGPPESSVIFEVELMGIQTAAAGAPGVIDVKTNSPDASYVIVRPGGEPLPARGSRLFTKAEPGRYRIKADAMRSYALGVLAVPGDMVLAPAGRLAITITYRAIIQ